MIKLYLIRHGETEWNKVKRFQGWTDIELSDIGKRQALLLGERFKNIAVDEIFSSPLKRAYNTAYEIARHKNIEIVTNEHFKEINFGQWEGMTAKEITEMYGEQFSKFALDPENESFPGEGSFEMVTRRVALGLEEILKDKEDKNIVVVSHGGVVRLMVKYLMGFEGEFYNKTWVDNTSITLIEMRKRGNLLRTFNDRAHLDNL